MQTQSIQSYEEFLREAMRRHWESPDASRTTFLAFLLASQEAWTVAWDETRARGLARPLLAGVAGAVTLSVLLRVLAGGPFGAVLAGTTLASLLALYGRERVGIRAKARAIENVVESFRGEFDALRREHERRSLPAAKWELMMEGLLRRFLDVLDETTGTDLDPSSAAGIREYVHSPTDRPPAR